MDENTLQTNQVTQTQAMAGTIAVPFHKHTGIDSPLLPFSNVSGLFPMVTTTPTWTPQSVANSIAFDSTTGDIWYYDTTNKAWKSTLISNATIRALFSGTSPISYNSTTGAISFLGTSQLLESFTAGESISAGNAVSVGPYQTDGGIAFDAKNTQVNTRTPHVTSVTIGFTVGNNANRGLFLLLGSLGDESAATVTYAGVSMTAAFTVIGLAGSYLWGYYLVAPSTGLNNLVISGLANSAGNSALDVGIYSYYNVAQSAPTVTTTTAASASSVSLNVTPTVNGSLILTGVATSDTVGTFTGTNDTNNSGSTPAIGGTYPGYYFGDSGILLNNNTLAVAVSGGATNNWSLAAFLLAPAATVSYRVFKSNTSSAGYNSNWKLNSFIGFSQGTYTVGQSASILLGGTDTNQASLLPPGQYYLGTSGAIALTGTRKVGIATGTTEILLTNIW